ncbi:MAG: hypothetical protein ACYDAO_02025 [Thermoplasmataceae archaeon]
MKSIYKMIAVIVIVVGITVPATYFAFSMNSQSSKIDIASFIPIDSKLVIRWNTNGSSYYLTVQNGTYGGIIPISTSELGSGFSSTTLNTNNSGGSGINVTYNSDYHGYYIYRISNISSLAALSGIFNGPLKLISLLSINNNSIYFSSISGGLFLVGSLNFLKISIGGHLKNSYYSNYHYLLSNQNMSFFTSFIKNNVTNIHGYLNYTSTSISVNTNSTYVKNVTTRIEDSLKADGISTQLIISKNSILLTFQLGLKDYYEFLNVIEIFSYSLNGILVK